MIDVYDLYTGEKIETRREEFSSFPARSVLRDGVQNDKDLFTLGELLDDLDFCIENPLLEEKAKTAARNYMIAQIRKVRQSDVARICGRSFGLGDIWKALLDQIEDLYNERKARNADVA